MKRAQLEARLAELQPELEEARAIEFLLMLDYMQAEGFIQIEDDRIYPLGVTV